MNKTKIKGCIFDLDGTLLDTIGDISNAMNTTLKDSGYGQHTTDKYKEFVGSGALNLVKKAIGFYESDEKVKIILDSYSKEYEKNILVETCPFEGIPELLAALSEKGIKLAVLSNKPDKATRFLIEKCFPSIKFEVVAGQLPDIPIKPDPQAALRISNIMGLKPDEISFIGDSPEDYKTAKNAGMLGINVLWGYRTEKQLLSAGAEILCKKPYDVLNVLSDYT